MAKGLVNRRRVAVVAVAAAALVAASLTWYLVRRSAREREIDALLVQVCGDDRAAHDAALEEFSRLRSAADIRYMARLLASGDIYERHVAPALASVGEPAFEPVIRAVGYPPYPRSYNAWILPAFAKKWLNERNARIRAEKVSAVERAGHFFRAVGRTSQPFLLSCIERGDRDSRRLAVGTLYRMAAGGISGDDVIPLISVKPLVPLLQDPNTDVAQSAARTLARQPEDAGPEALMAIFKHANSDVALEGFLALTTAGISGDIEPPLSPEIGSHVMAVATPGTPYSRSGLLRHLALTFLQYFSDAESAEFLAAALGDADWFAALAAARSLHVRGDARGRAWLIEAYRTEGDPEKRDHGLWGLAQRGDAEILGILFDSSDEIPISYRMYRMTAAARALQSGTAAPSYAALLRAALREKLFGPDADSQRAVMTCLGNARYDTVRYALGPEMADEIFRLWREDLKSTDSAVRMTAWLYIGSGQPPHVEDLIWETLAVETNQEVRHWIYYALFKLTKREIRDRHDRENGYE